MVLWTGKRLDGSDDRGRLRTVALVGIDGSGKTTQARRLASSLGAAGVRTGYWRNAGGRRWLDRLAHRLGRPDGPRLVGRAGALVIESGLRWLAIAWALVRSGMTGRLAVMDRYAVCQYARIRAHGRVRWEPLARWAYRLFPPPDITFMLTVRPVEAYRRIEDRGTDHEELDDLIALDAAYRLLPESADFVMIDANGTPDEVGRAILAHLDGDTRSDEHGSTDDDTGPGGHGGTGPGRTGAPADGRRTDPGLGAAERGGVEPVGAAR
jgi:dTMP kinase